MKYLLILFLSCFIIPSSFAQWGKLYTNTTEDLNAIHFSDENHGYICGSNGYVGKTVNGGTSWTDVSISKPFMLHDIFFFDSMEGYVVGMNSLIYHTMNGGTDWTEAVPISVDTDLKSISFMDKNFGIVVGEAGKLFIYENGTWEKQSYEQRLNFNDVTITDFGLAIIAADSGQVFLKPQDSIRFHESANLGKNSPLLAVQYVENTIYAAGGYYDDSLKLFQQIFLESLDSGNSFQKLNGLDFDMLSKMHFITKDKGYYLGKANGFYSTENQMSQTIRLFPGTNNSLNNFFFLNEDIVFTCGVVGTVTKSIHGGGWATDIKEIPNTIYYYPNPAKDILHIAHQSTIKEVKIFDMQGKVLLAQANTNSIDVSTLLTGLYIVQSTTKKGEKHREKIEIQ